LTLNAGTGSLLDIPFAGGIENRFIIESTKIIIFFPLFCGKDLHNTKERQVGIFTKLEGHN